MAPRRKALTIETKKQVIEFYDKNKSVSLDYIASYFSNILVHKVGRTSVFRIIGNREKIMSCETNQKKKNERVQIH